MLILILGGQVYAAAQSAVKFGGPDTTDKYFVRGNALYVMFYYYMMMIKDVRIGCVRMFNTPRDGPQSMLKDLCPDLRRRWWCGSCWRYIMRTTWARDTERAPVYR